MAEGMRRPTIPENMRAYSARLAAASLSKFEIARGLSLALEEDWAGMHSDPIGHFSVHTKGEKLVIKCLSSRAHGWHRIQWLAKNGFAGRTVELVKAFGKAAS